MALEPDAGLGQGAGLVGAQHVHRTHVLDRRRAFDDHLQGRHAQRAVRQGDRHHHRQQFGREPHGQRDRKQERLQQRALECDVDEQREQHQQQGQPHDEHAKVARAGLERRRRRLQRQTGCDLAQCGRVAAAPDQHPGRTTDHRTAHEHRILGVQFPAWRTRCRCCWRRQRGGVFLDRVGLAGQLCLVDEEVVGLQHPGIGGHQVAGTQQHHVARNQLGHRELARRSVAQHGRGQRHFQRQPLGALPGTVLLHEIQRHAHEHDQRDDDGAGAIPGQCGQRAGGQQHQHQRVAQMGQELQQHRPLPGWLQPVGAEAAQVERRLCAAQARLQVGCGHVQAISRGHARARAAATGPAARRCRAFAHRSAGRAPAPRPPAHRVPPPVPPPRPAASRS